MIKHALIIDDEPDVATYLATVLEDNGWQTRIAHGGEEGLSLARESRPDLVLLDVMMPDKGGLSTLVAFRKDADLAGVPILLVTGIQQELSWSFDRVLDAARNYHPDGYVEKPIEPADLIRAVDEAVAARVGA